MLPTLFCALEKVFVEREQLREVYLACLQPQCDQANVLVIYVIIGQKNRVFVHNDYKAFNINTHY